MNPKITKNIKTNVNGTTTYKLTIENEAENVAINVSLLVYANEDASKLGYIKINSGEAEFSHEFDFKTFSEVFRFFKGTRYAGFKFNKNGEHPFLINSKDSFSINGTVISLPNISILYEDFEKEFNKANVLDAIEMERRRIDSVDETDIHTMKL